MQGQPWVYHAEPMLREVKRRGRTGREISEFVGPVGAINGMLTPFRLPRMRARIVPAPVTRVISERKRGLSRPLA